MGRRANGEGSVYRRASDQRWIASFYDLNGRRREVSARTRAEAERKRREAISAREKGLPAFDAKTAVSAFLSEWLTVTGPTLKASSAQRYELAVRNHILPVLGGIPLTRVTPQHIQALHRRLEEKNLAPATIAHIHDIANAAFADAERWEIILRNPVRLVSPPQSTDRKMAPLTQLEARRLVSRCEDEPLGPLFAVLVSTGMRVGEALAARWSEVDLDRGTVQVIATLTRTAEGYQPTEPKTASARRLVYLPRQAVEALRRQRTHQAAMRLRAGAAYVDNGFVFTDGLGSCLDPDGIVRKHWKALLKKMEIADRRLHDLRHTFATIQLEQGTAIKFVAGQLGHANSSITLNRYSHVTPTGLEQVRAAMEAALGG